MHPHSEKFEYKDPPKQFLLVTPPQTPVLSTNLGVTFAITPFSNLGSV